MEALWIFPLYFLFPISGIILLIFGIYKYRKHKKTHTLIIGLMFVSLPILHLSMMELIEINLKSEIVGEYLIKDTNIVVLKVKDDGTFILNKTPQLERYGKGKWTILRWDIDELDLHFSNFNESEIALEIASNGILHPIENPELELKKKIISLP